ncbi:MAG TPA: tetratricopeptide repeat protein [Bacteroidia bacterium]|nr:tetratricopeptide repeat protein [Bacteroidia bacterium]
MKSTIKIFSETGCISHDVLWKYRMGTLSTAEKHEVELHLTDCDLCSDALSGMMNMESDSVVAELRSSVRNISTQKKVIRLYDFRVLAAAAAVAVLLVFTYVISSTNKNQNKEIALFTKPEEKNKVESSSFNNSQPTDEIDLSKKKTEDLTSAKAITKLPAEQKIFSEGFAMVNRADVSTAEQPDADIKAEEIVATDVGFVQTVPSQPETKSSAYDANATPAAATMEQGENSPSARKKSSRGNKNQKSSKEFYYHDLKVAQTPAMTSVEKSDSVNTGTPAPYETKNQEEIQQPTKELPFVYSKTLKDGMGYYKNKKYQYAIQTFDIILERFPNDINATFYKGLSEMETQNFSTASELFKKVLVNQDAIFKQEAKFKLALCYLAMNQTGEAKKLLEQISAEGGFYNSKAKEELENLK